MNNQAQNHKEKTQSSFSYTVLGVILPFILSLIPIVMFSKYEAIAKFIDDGDFLLFAAGLFTTSIYLFKENRESIQNKADKILNGSCFWLLIASSCFYATIYCVELLKITLPINHLFVRLASLILLALSITSAYRAIYIDFLKVFPVVDVEAESRRDVDDIMDQL